MERRFFLKGLGVLGCSAVAHPFVTPLMLAVTPAANRLLATQSS